MSTSSSLGDWSKMFEKLTRKEPVRFGKSFNYYWIQPEHNIFMSNTDFKNMKQWCKDSLGYCNTNEPKFRFYFKTEADRTAFMIVWCFEKPN